MKDKFLKPYILAISALFLGSILQGYILAVQNQEMAQLLISQLAEDLSFLNNVHPFFIFFHRRMNRG